MFNEKPVISNQYGALVMAFVPFFYALCSVPFVWQHICFGVAWLFLCLFSYPFFALFSKTPTPRNKKWAAIYALLFSLFALPVLFFEPHIFQFAFFLIPLALIQIYYARQHDERHLINDLAGICTFGIVGMAAAYLTTGGYFWEIFTRPTLFFIATTLYIKSVARERRNPRYVWYSLISHLLFGAFSVWQADYLIAAVYGLAFVRAAVVPRLNFNIKQVGMAEFPLVLLFLLSLIFQS